MKDSVNGTAWPEKKLFDGDPRKAAAEARAARDHDKAIDPEETRQVREEQILQCRSIVDAFIAEKNPVMRHEGQLEKADYYVLRLTLAKGAEELFGHPVTTGAVKHWLPRFGLYYTVGQKEKLDRLIARDGRE